jgi:hypothetical protein
MAKHTPEVPTYDPFASYDVHSFNKKYTGDCNGVRFTNGKAFIEALPRDADEDEQQDRINQLFWFYNADPAMVLVKDDREELERKYFPGYTIEARGAKSRKPELVGA